MESVDYNTRGVSASMDEITDIKGVEASDAEDINGKSPDESSSKSHEGQRRRVT